MQPTVQTGYLVLADISGYTSFMAKTELAHSQGIMGDVLNLWASTLFKAWPEKGSPWAPRSISPTVC